MLRGTPPSAARRLIRQPLGERQVAVSAGEPLLGRLRGRSVVHDFVVVAYLAFLPDRYRRLGRSHDHIYRFQKQPGWRFICSVFPVATKAAHVTRLRSRLDNCGRSIAKQHLVGTLGKFWRNIANGLCAGLCGLSVFM
jgi:hypothetical protein